MLKKLVGRFLSFPFWLKIIWIFCLLGVCCNSILLWRDWTTGGSLWRLHVGFWVLYAGQVVFILAGERWVFVISLVQAVLGFGTSLDLTFVPVLRFIGRMIYEFKGGLTLEEQEVYKYVFVSLAFTLEMLKTYLLFALIPPYQRKKPLQEPVSEELN